MSPISMTICWSAGGNALLNKTMGGFVKNFDSTGHIHVRQLEKSLKFLLDGTPGVRVESACVVLLTQQPDNYSRDIATLGRNIEIPMGPWLLFLECLPRNQWFAKSRCSGWARGRAWYLSPAAFDVARLWFKHKMPNSAVVLYAEMMVA